MVGFLVGLDEDGGLTFTDVPASEPGKAVPLADVLASGMRHEMECPKTWTNEEANRYAIYLALTDAEFSARLKVAAHAVLAGLQPPASDGERRLVYRACGVALLAARLDPATGQMTDG